MLAQLTEAELLACSEPEVAAHKILGMVQEFEGVAIGPSAAALPPAEVVTDEALLTFLSRYRRPRREVSARQHARGR